MRLLAIIRNIVWPAVFAVALSLAAIALAILLPDMLALTVAIGSAAITSAVLSTRI